MLNVIKRNKIKIVLILFLFLGFLIPQNIKMPVKGAKKSDYNSESFWYYPWGKSVTHKGVDIFARKGTKIYSSTKGFILHAGKNSLGGNFVLILGPKWRLHYYAHLSDVECSSLSFTSQEKIIGTVGTSGNAVGKQPHLHYSIVSLIPYVWRVDNSKQGWKKMFYLNPITYFKK